MEAVTAFFGKRNSRESAKSRSKTQPLLRQAHQGKEIRDIRFFGIATIVGGALKCPLEGEALCKIAPPG
jgi:hypothetical protein